MDETTAGPLDAGFDPQRLRTVLALRRPTDDRMIAGVCTGLARYLRLDPVVVRVLMVALAVVGGLGVILYGTVWLLTPDVGSDRAPLGKVDDLDSGPTRPIVLVCAGLLAIGAIVGPGVLWWAPWPALVVVGLVAWLLLRGRGGAPPAAHGPAEAETTGAGTTATDAPMTQSPSDADILATTSVPPAPTTTVPLPDDPPYSGGGAATPPDVPPGESAPPPPPSPRQRRRDGGRLTLLGLGLVALVFAGGWISDRAGNPVEAPVLVAIALGVVGACLLAGSWIGNSRPLVLPAILLGAALAITSLTPAWSAGERRVAPTTSAAVEDSYEFGVGRQAIDLSGVTDVEALDGRTVDIHTEVGETVVTVPEGVDVTVTADVDLGEVDVYGVRADHGTDSHITVADPDTSAPDLEIEVTNTVGRIEVDRA